MNFPNFDKIIDYISKDVNNNGEALEIIHKKLKNLKNSNFIDMKLAFRVFPQVWPNTACGIDLTRKGEPCISGQSLTECYTVIVDVRAIGKYYIFFDGIPAYIVDYDCNKFDNDLKNSNLEPLSGAGKYKGVRLLQRYA